MSKIFLSHSGFQKPFVMRLKDALQAAGHSPFFDAISLPKAEPFPRNIEEALRKCKLGVVVLSEEFMTSHWPMRELALLHHNPLAKIFPLFYNLCPHDLKSKENLSRWRPKWTELGKKHGVDTSEWEKVVRSLASVNGEVFRRGSNEASYIHKVVEEICRLVPLSPHYDVLGVNGGYRLSEVVMSKFQTAQSACKSISCACTIALHGVGGAGKTTICKLLANAFSSHYPGKSLLLEFPSDGNKKSIAKACKKLLRHCTNASDEHVLRKATSLNEIFPELDKRISEHPIFLAIDNIWESTSEVARRLLQVKFHKETKILITSRSRAVLKELLKGCDEATCIDAVPSMILEEALRTFEMSFDHDLSYAPPKLLDRALNLCLFEDSYHPLAIKALGKRLRRMQGDRIDLKEMEANISHLSCSLVDANIETLIRINYDSIPLIRQHMFLDIVAVFLSDAFQQRCHRRNFGGYDAIQKGLMILYADEQHSKYDICILMHQLAWDGLLDFEGRDADRRIVVHDLYLDLARREAIASPRFFLGVGQEINSRDWSMVKRVVLPRGMEKKMVKVIEQNCPQLELLIAVGPVFEPNYYNMGALQLGKHMGALRILILQYMFLDISTSMVHGKQEGGQGTSGGKHVDGGWRGCVGRLAWLELVSCSWGHAVEAIYDMDRLEVLILENCSCPWKDWTKLCHGCGCLEEISIRDCQFDDSIINNSLRSLSKLKNLRLSKVTNLNSCAVMANLQHLEVYWCSDLEKICSLGPLPGLITLSVFECRLLQAITGLNGASQLQKFKVYDCPLLKVIPRMNGLVKFEIRRVESLEEIQGLQDLMNLRMLIIEKCPLLKAIPALSGAVQLTHIQILECGSIEEIPAVGGLINLKWIDISMCPRLKAILLDLRGAVQLERVRFEFCESLQQIPALRGLTNLRELFLRYCPCLKAILDLSGAAKL